MKTIAVAALKGGVGKSTTSINIARGLARTGASVGAFDLDRNSRTLTGFTGGVEGVHVQATTAGRLAGIVSRGAFDYAVFDLAPSLAKESATALKVADLVIITVQPKMPNVPPLILLLDSFEAARDPERGGNTALQGILLFTMCDKRDAQAEGIEAEIREQVSAIPGISIWPESVAMSLKISDAGNDFLSVLDTAPGSEGAHVYRGLANYIAAPVSLPIAS